MAHSEFWVAGEPATFATKGERPWKDAIEAQAPAPTPGGGERGLRLDFAVRELAPWGQPRDLDNLVEPALSALVNARGWFGGARPNIDCWLATVAKADVSGCRVTIDGGTRNSLVTAPTFEGIYSGPLPRSGRAEEIPVWIQSVMPDLAGWQPPDLATLELEFASRHVNLGDIATGPVKSAIDCLYPLLGGEAGAPRDHVIRHLRVAKGVRGLAENSVRIQLWREIP